MRIAVYENLPPGGALRTSFEVGRQLIARGHEIDLYRLSTYADKGAFDLAPQVHAVEVLAYRPLGGSLERRLRTGRLAPRSYTLFAPLKRLHRKLAALIRSRSYDVLLAHPDAMTGSPYLLRWLDGLPTVYYCQEPPRFASETAAKTAHRENLASSPGPVGPLRVLEDMLVLGRLATADAENVVHAGQVLVNSVYSRERVWAAYARTATVCYLGIDPDRFSPTETPGERRREVISLGGPIAAKGHLLIIEALARLRKDTRPSLRVVLPRGVDSTVLGRAAGRAQVDLTVESGLPETAVIERYRSAIATVCAGRLEPFGLTALESMACGTPVVAIREAGYRESVVDGVTGILVEPDPASIAAGVERLAGDQRLVTVMGLAGRKDVVEHWTWKRTGDHMESILEGVARK